MKRDGAGFRELAAPVLVVWAGAAASLFFDRYTQYVTALLLVAIMVGIALVILVGLARMITLASGAMMGLGAYGTAAMMVHWDAPFLVGVAFATALGALGGLLLGLPATRFRGHHLAMVTMVFQFVVIIVISEWDSLTGGVEGMRVPQATIAGYALKADWEYVVLIAFFAGLSILFAGILIRGHFGKALKAMSATEVGAEAFGIYVAGYQVMAFVISSAIIALGGALFAPEIRILDPDQYGILSSVLMLAYPIVGGMTSLWGGIIGGGLLRAGPELLRVVDEYQELVYAAIVIAVIVFLPGGLVEIYGRVAAALGGKRAKASPPERPQAAARAAALGHLAGAHPVSHPKGLVALKTASVSKSYGSLKAVSAVDLTVAAGSMHGLIGPNGAGKTTFFNTISGFIPPDEGTIEIFGRRMAEEPARARIRFGVARTFQNVAVYRTLSCLDNVIIGVGENDVVASLWHSIDEAVGGRASRARRERALNALAAVGLADVAGEAAGSLSLGNQRRVEIARAIVSKPKLILLDEPVSGVGAEEEERLKELLRSLNRELGVTMFVIEHNIRFVVDLCERLSVMSNGRIIAEGASAEVIKSDDVRRVYFGEG
ncbi:MAG: branched-chain amino acid ABC transporter ATP-binding protein/permease [Alphaproteobacteria bacterium]|nr:branched-chain amino acid ABC transporter ATP-binding protein/permease [Alphaproteobacteria bacterium]